MKRLALLLALFAGSANAAITGTVVQCAFSHDFASANDVEVVDNGDGWSTPSAGNILVGGVAVETDTNESYACTMPSPLTERQSNMTASIGSFNSKGCVGEGVAAGTESSLTFNMANSPNTATAWVCELDSTDLDTTLAASNIDDSDEATSVTSFTTGSASNTVNDALAIYIGNVSRDAGWDNNGPTFSTGTSQLVTTQNAVPGVYVATEVLSSTGSQSSTISTTDSGFPAVGFILVYDGAPAECEVDDASPVPGTTISVTNCPAFSGNITTLTSPEGDAITAESGADTTSADFIIPVSNEFEDTGEMGSTEMDVDGTWTVGDGSTTEDLTLQIDPPSGADFGQVTDWTTGSTEDSMFYQSQQTGISVGDDYLFEVNSGTCEITSAGVVSASSLPCEADLHWFDDSADAWTRTTYTFTDASDEAPAISDLDVQTNYRDDSENDRLDVSIITDVDNGTLHWCFDTGAETDVDTPTEIKNCTGGTGSNQSVTTTGSQSFQSAALAEGDYWLGGVQTSVGGSDSNVLTGGEFTIDTTAPGITNEAVSNINIGAGTVTLAADFDDTSADAWYWCTGEGAAIVEDIIDNGVQFAPTNGTNTFNSVSVDDPTDDAACHLYQIDPYGNPTTVSVTFDIALPTVESIAVAANGTDVVLGFSEALDVGSGGNGGLSATGSVSGAITLTYDSGDGTDEFTYTASPEVVFGETVTVSYTQPGDGLEDQDGNDLASFSGLSAVNNLLDEEAPVIIDVEIE